jgi:hypothetical protein
VTLRLLDHVAQSDSPFLVRQFDGELWQLTGPSAYAREVAGCPLRYVLSDQLVRNCIELAYSEGAGVCGCLDLIHLPAERLWIEWSGVAQREAVLRVMPECSGAAASAECLRHGVLLRADAGGRRGALRTFWLPAAEPHTPLLAPLETLIDLDRENLPESNAATLLAGDAVRVQDSRSAEVDDLLECARFRLDPAWHRYYSTVASSPGERRAVLERSLGTVAFDVPALLALFLLMALRSELIHVPISTNRINLKRARLGRAPLLAHIEVSCPVFAAPEHRPVGEELTPRTGPRLHHVRGHIVRREDAVFWRRPHWRGHLRLGCVRSRTVNLRLEGALR